MNFEIDVDVPYSIVVDLIRSAVEAKGSYGLGCWGYIDPEKTTPPQKASKLHQERMQAYLDKSKEQEVWYAHWPLFNGKTCIAEHFDGHSSPVEHFIECSNLFMGLKLMAAKHPEKFGEIFIDGQIDGALGEEFLQLCVFEELKYG